MVYKIPFSALLAVALLLGPATAIADPAQDDALRRREAAVPDSAADTSQKLDYIMTLFEREQRPARIWTFGWQAGFGGIMLGQAIWSLATNDIDTRRERGIGAAAASIGFGTHFMAWLPARTAYDDLKADGGDDLSRLARAEEILEEGHKREKFTRGILTHLGGLIVAGTSSMILWKVWDLPSKGALNFPVATAVGQTRIWTQPVLSMRGWQAYHDAYGAKPEVSFGIVPRPDGLALALSF